MSKMAFSRPCKKEKYILLEFSQSFSHVFLQDKSRDHFHMFVFTNMFSSFSFLLLFFSSSSYSSSSSSFTSSSFSSSWSSSPSATARQEKKRLHFTRSWLLNFQKVCKSCILLIFKPFTPQKVKIFL